MSVDFSTPAKVENISLFAKKLMNEILNGRRALNERTALLFEAVLGVEAEPLLSLQTRYNMQTIRQDRSFMRRLLQVRKVAAVL